MCTVCKSFWYAFLYFILQFQLSNVWFDRYNVSPDVPEHAQTLEEIGKVMADFVQNIIKSDGLNLNRIIIGMSFLIFI